MIDLPRAWIGCFSLTITQFSPFPHFESSQAVKLFIRTVGIVWPVSESQTEILRDTFDAEISSQCWLFGLLGKTTVSRSAGMFTSGNSLN